MSDFGHYLTSNAPCCKHDVDTTDLISSGTVALAYDPLGRLHDVGASTHTRFLYDGADVIAEYDGNNTLLQVAPNISSQFRTA